MENMTQPFLKILNGFGHTVYIIIHKLLYQGKKRHITHKKGHKRGQVHFQIEIEKVGADEFDVSGKSLKRSPSSQLDKLPEYTGKIIEEFFLQKLDVGRIKKTLIYRWVLVVLTFHVQALKKNPS